MSIHLKKLNGIACKAIKDDNTKSAFLPRDCNCLDCLKTLYPEINFRYVVETSFATNEKRVNVVAETNGSRVASAKYIHSKSFMPIIMDVWVKPEFRGKGIATIILKQIMQAEGPPIQLKAEPYSEDGEPTGLEEDKLKKFYEKLGFFSLPSGKMMLWYPTVSETPTTTIVVKYEGVQFEASLESNRDVRAFGKNSEEAIGRLISSYDKIFGVKITRRD